MPAWTRLFDLETTVIGIRPVTQCFGSVFVNNRKAATVRDRITRFVATTGSSTVFAGNLPVHRIGDRNSGRGFSIQGSPNVYVD
jgi:hypothetical protein